MDGKLSQTCYLSAVDQCYQSLADKVEARAGVQPVQRGQSSAFSLQDVDMVIMHSPYSKLVQKGVARLAFMDLRRQHTTESDAEAAAALVGLEADAARVLGEWCAKPLEGSYTCRPLEVR